MPSLFKPRSKESAFTITELLVVIVTILILAALTFPVLKIASASAKDSKCIVNMRSLVAAIQLYRVDHDGVLPPSWLDGTGTTPDNTWTYLVAPYMGISVGKNAAERAKEMSPHLTCSAEDTKGNWNPPSQYWHSHYGVNVSGGQTFNYTDDGKSRAFLKYPSQTMMLIETRNARGVKARPASISSIAPRHKEKANVAYFDTHMEKIRISEIPASGGDVFWSEW